MEITWTEIFNDNELELFHALFRKMEIIKIQLNEEQEWKFKGCYILNLDYQGDLGKLSDFHFYTTNYLINDSVKRMCIQPLSILDDSHKKDTDEKINKRLITWFLNNQQILRYGLDVLGQSHGQYIEEKIQQFLSGTDWDQIKIETSDESNDKANNYDRKHAASVAKLLDKDKILHLLKNAKKLTIEEIFS